MANAIKYNLSAETLALKKGNFWIGTGDVGKGPTSSTGFYNGLEVPTDGYTIYLNKASGGPSIYTVSTESQLTALTNTISVTTNLIKNNNGGNFTNGTVAPFNGSYGTLPTIVDISNDRPYVGSTSTKAAKFVAGGGMNIYTDPSPFTMTVGVTYTFSFWYRQTNSNNFYIAFNNQGGSGDVNGNFQAYSSYGYFSNPTQTWQRCSWTFTNVVNKPYFFIYSFNSVAGSECLMTEFTLTEGSMPSGPGLTTSGNCLNWFSTQTDKMIFNRDYPAIVTSGLTLNLDAGFSPSFATIPSNANGNTLPSWYDLSGNDSNGTLINGPTYSSLNGGSIVFDGVDDYVSLGTQASWNTPTGTMAAWVKITGTGSDIGGILTNQTTGFNLHCFFVSNYNSSNQTVTIQYALTHTNPNAEVYATSTESTNTWLYIVGTRYYNGTNTVAKLYVNGVLKSTVTLSGSIEQTANGFILGRFYGTRAMIGNIAVAQIYNRDLTASEISQNYEAIGTRYRTLQVQSLVVAGGGAGGGYGYPSGGGGAGGLLTGYTTSLSLNTNYTITVGAGGSSNSNGSNSVFNTLTSIGGGRGGNGRSASGVSGGSGGGGGSNYPADLPSPYLTPAGSGTVGQGNNGGVGKSVYSDTSVNGVPTGAGGGGGAGAVGGTGTITPSIKAGDGGTGLYFSEYSTIGGYPSGWFAGGGGGSTSYSSTATNAVGVGGNGGGGNGSYTQFSSGPTATDGIVNTGGGGGGAGYIEYSSANGGSGIVILKIPDVYTARFSSGVSASVTKSGGYKYYKVTATSTTSETVSFS